LSSKNPLLKGSCIWILKDPAFTEWWNNDGCSILWIHGDPGKGKTMMMIALIDEIQQRLDVIPGSGVLSYFFCQNTIQELNNAVSIIRGLTYLLAKQNPALTHHLRKRYDDTNRSPFEGFNALQGLWNMLLEISHDPSLPRVYLLVDALDECDSESLGIFLKLLSASELSGKVKWVVTSRNETRIVEHHRCHPAHEMSLELNSSHVSKAVKSFIDFKVRELAVRKRYDSELQASVRDYLTDNAEGTFLWVALVCKALESVLAGTTERVLKTFPAGLEPLYERMMGQIEHERDFAEVGLCKQILCTVTLACRPLCLNEIGIIAGLPEDVSNNLQYLQGLVESCGAFLTLREQTVYLVHQSAKDYFITGKGSNIFPFGQIKTHDQLAHRSLRLMLATLKRDVCSLCAPGVLTKDVGSVTVEQCLSSAVQYACIYWVQHLQKGSTQLHDNDQVHQFLRTHLLYWLEALSLIGKILEGVHAITSLESYVLVSHLVQYMGIVLMGSLRPIKVQIYTRLSMTRSDFSCITVQ
jgi:NACHT domain